MMSDTDIGETYLQRFQLSESKLSDAVVSAKITVLDTERLSKKAENIARKQETAFIQSASEKSSHEMDNAAMTGISREEFEARLNSTHADVRADFAQLRSDMADARRESSEHLNQMRILTVEQLSAMRVDISSMSKELTREIGRVGEGVAEVRGSVDGLKSSITMLQFVLALAAAVAGLWLAFQQLRVAETPPVSTISTGPAATPATTLQPTSIYGASTSPVPTPPMPATAPAAQQSSPK